MMKKKILFCFVAFWWVSLSVVFAQKNDFKPELAVGINGGALYSSVDFSPAVLQKTKLGATGGITARYISEKSLGLQVELNFSQRGWTEEFDSTGFAYSRTLNYVEIPLLWHIYFGDKMRFIMNMGPQLSCLIGSSAEMSDALAADIESRRQADTTAKIGMQYYDVRTKFDYGLIGGLGMELKSGIGSFILEGRYYFGFGDIFENGRTATSYFSRSAHRLIEAKLSYLYTF